MDKIIKINKLKINKDNPRIIKDEKFKKLINSIKEFPEMLELRPIVVDENMIILGGNMRYRACIEAGIKEVPIKIAKGLTEEQKKEFTIKDNASFGDWDWDSLGNEWNTIDLTKWGGDVWQNSDDKNNLDAELEWTDMPEFNQDDLTPNRQLIISFKTEKDIQDFANLIGQNITEKTKSLWFPKVENEKLFDKIYE